MKTNVLDRALSHAGAEKVRRIEVPEWGEPAVLDEDGNEVTPAKPLAIFYRMLTLDDLALVHESDGDSWHRQAARIVCMKAQDENGNKIFRMTDALQLRSGAAPDVVNRVAFAILGRVSQEQARKN